MRMKNWVGISVGLKTRMCLMLNSSCLVGSKSIDDIHFKWFVFAIAMLSKQSHKTKPRHSTYN